MRNGRVIKVCGSRSVVNESNKILGSILSRREDLKTFERFSIVRESVVCCRFRAYRIPYLRSRRNRFNAKPRGYRREQIELEYEEDEHYSDTAYDYLNGRHIKKPAPDSSSCRCRDEDQRHYGKPLKASSGIVSSHITGQITC